MNIFMRFLTVSFSQYFYEVFLIKKSVIGLCVGCQVKLDSIDSDEAYESNELNPKFKAQAL